MTSAHDVAAFILEDHGPTTTKKLQKLLYYAQAWSLVWDEAPLFSEAIEAWRDGPVVPVVWAPHASIKWVDTHRGRPEALSDEQRATVRAVVAFYAAFDGDDLSDLTHAELPWREARGELGAKAPSSNVISLDSMRVFFERLRDPTQPKVFSRALRRGYRFLLSLSPAERDALGTLADPSEIEAIALS